MTPIVRFIKLTSPPELEQAIGDGIHSCGLDAENLDHLLEMARVFLVGLSLN